MMLSEMLNQPTFTPFRQRNNIFMRLRQDKKKYSLIRNLSKVWIFIVRNPSQVWAWVVDWQREKSLFTQAL